MGNFTLDTYPSKTFSGYIVQLFYVFGITMFFIAFVLIYRPAALVEYLGGDGRLFSFNLSILTAIVFLLLLVSRLLYYLRRNHIKAINTYLLWCFVEGVALCSFFAMFFSLTTGSLFFDSLYRMFSLLLPVLLLPYTILTLAVIVHEYRLHGQEEMPVGSRMKFYDSHHLLKFSSSDSSVLYIEAGENYVRINYEEGDRIKEHILRTSMKSIEEMCRSHGILRCHRSFFVNVKRVNVLRKDGDGFIYVELDNREARRIPVSKTYYEQVSSFL